MVLSNSKTNCVGETLAKRTRSDFNTLSIMSFGVTRCDTVDRLEEYKSEEVIIGVLSSLHTYSEGFEIIHRKLVSAEMEECILEHAAVSVAIRCQLSWNGEKRF